MIENRGALGDVHVRGLTAQLLEVDNQAEKNYVLALDSSLGVESNDMTRLFKRKSSTKARETTTNISGFGRLTQFGDGENYPNDSRVSGYSTEWNFIQYGSRYEITRMAIDDGEDYISDYKDPKRNLMVAGKYSQDVDAFGLFREAFTAQDSLSDGISFLSDGVPMCSTLHPLKGKDGVTHSNASATSIPLSDINLEIAKQALRRQLDDKGLPMQIGSGNNILLVPDSLESNAVRIAQSTKRSGTANNDLNIFDGTVTVISTKLINSQQTNGSDTAWFLIDPMMADIIFFEREGLTTRHFQDDDNDNFIWKIRARYTVGYKDWRGIWGSKGDNSAYSA